MQSNQRGKQNKIILPRNLPFTLPQSFFILKEKHSIPCSKNDTFGKHVHEDVRTEVPLIYIPLSSS